MVVLLLWCFVFELVILFVAGGFVNVQEIAGALGWLDLKAVSKGQCRQGVGDSD
jgi:hypothetical protein